MRYIIGFNQSMTLLHQSRQFNCSILEFVLGLQDLKYKILVKGKKERVVEGCSSSCSDLSSSDEESIQAKAKKEDKKVRTAAAPFGPYFTAQIQTVVTIKQKSSIFLLGLT